jgi:hypothetical protein
MRLESNRTLKKTHSWYRYTALHHTKRKQAGTVTRGACTDMIIVTVNENNCDNGSISMSFRSENARR